MEQCPSFSLYWALCAPQSGLTGIWRLRTWRLDSNSPCSAAGRNDHGSGRWIAPSGSGSLGVGQGGARRSTSFAPRRPRDGDSLASKGLPFVLDLEVPARANGSTAHRIGACGTRSHHGARQSSLGRAAHPRRVAQARAPRLAADCCPSHAASPEAAFADLAKPSFRTTSPISPQSTSSLFRRRPSVCSTCSSPCCILAAESCSSM